MNPLLALRNLTYSPMTIMPRAAVKACAVPDDCTHVASMTAIDKAGEPIHHAIAYDCALYTSDEVLCILQRELAELAGPDYLVPQ